MLLKEVVNDRSPSDVRIWIKSENEPVTWSWPALAFSNNKSDVARIIQRDFRHGIDLIVFVGTGSAPTKIECRSKILSAFRVDPSKIMDTVKLVSPEHWRKVQRDAEANGGSTERWTNAFPITEAWEFALRPAAKDIIGDTYRTIGHGKNRGGLVLLNLDERYELLRHSVKPINLKDASVGLHLIARERQPSTPRLGPISAAAHAIQQIGTQSASTKQSSPSPTPSEGTAAHTSVLQREIIRIAQLIDGRIKSSGTELKRTAPERKGPGPAELRQMLLRKWEEQNGKCYLCSGLMVLDATNSLMQPSPDRIDSHNIHYSEQNVRLAHLGCNLAKNDGTKADFSEWLRTAAAKFVTAPQKC